MNNKQKTLAGLLIGLAGSAFFLGLAYAIKTGDKIKATFQKKYRNYEFAENLTLLAKMVCCTQKRTDDVHIEFFRKYFLENFGRNITQECLNILKNKDIKLPEKQQIFSKIKTEADYATKIQILNFLFAFGSNSSETNEKQEELLREFSLVAEIRMRDFEKIKSQFVSRKSCYEIPEDASTDDIIKA